MRQHLWFLSVLLSPRLLPKGRWTLMRRYFFHEEKTIKSKKNWSVVYDCIYIYIYIYVFFLFYFLSLHFRLVWYDFWFHIKSHLAFAAAQYFCHHVARMRMKRNGLNFYWVPLQSEDQIDFYQTFFFIVDTFANTHRTSSLCDSVLKTQYCEHVVQWHETPQCSIDSPLCQLLWQLFNWNNKSMYPLLALNNCISEVMEVGVPQYGFAVHYYYVATAYCVFGVRYRRVLPEHQEPLHFPVRERRRQLQVLLSCSRIRLVC